MVQRAERYKDDPPSDEDLGVTLHRRRVSIGQILQISGIAWLIASTTFGWTYGLSGWANDLARKSDIDALRQTIEEKFVTKEQLAATREQLNYKDSEIQMQINRNREDIVDLKSIPAFGRK